MSLRDRTPSPQTRALLEAFLTAPADWRYGYDISKLLGLSSGTLYPTLIRLHERGLLEAEWREPERPGRPARHAYRLSADGVRYARRHLQPGEAPSRPQEALA